MVTDLRLPVVRDTLLAALALGMFAFGLLIYLAERDPARVWLMPAGCSIASPRGLLPGVVRDSGQTFVHSYVFSVLTALPMRPTRRE